MNTAERKVRVVAVILAAGFSERFGSNKLITNIGGKTMIERTMEAIPRSDVWKIAVVTHKDGNLESYMSNDITIVVNDHAKEGIGSSISAATRFFYNSAEAILFILADQPFVGEENIRKLLSEFSRCPESIISSSVKGETRNPVVFPRRFFDLLSDLSGDKGAKGIVDANIDSVIKVEVDSLELLDVDTMDDLARIQKVVNEKEKNDSE